MPFLASFRLSLALLEPCLPSNFLFSSNAIMISDENSVPMLFRNTFLLKNTKNNTFRTVKLEKPRFFKVFQGFTVFAF